MSRYSAQEKILGKETLGVIQSSRVLMVGAGGIGCELLKNLVMTGFQKLEIVDLDTIDLSNLNRQFLFQKQHINKPKAIVAKESAERFNPDVEIVAHHSSIFEKKFDLDWFQSFDIVLNALDNLPARRHVNLMCQAAGVPLVESGTAGYLGQTTVHVKGKTACFDCEPKPTPKTFPVCTIRSTPSQPIHCIVWAKSYLFPKLFGNDEEDDNQIKESESDNKEELRVLNQESQELLELKSKIEKPGFGKSVFEKIFEKDIKRILEMTDLWKEKKKPVPITSSSFSKKKITLPTGLAYDQNTWSVEENYQVFLDSVRKLSVRLNESRKEDPTATIDFDKDDEDALDFVTSASNLRAHAYHISMMSRFKVKEMAGNIIPAIATTNAIAAGLVTIQAIKILKGEVGADTYIQYYNPSSILTKAAPADRNKMCVVCNTNYLQLTCDANTTLQEVVDAISSVEQGDVYLEESGRILYDPDFDDNSDRTLKDLNIDDGARLMGSIDGEKEYLICAFIKFGGKEVGVKMLDKVLKEKPKIEPTEEKKRKAEDELEMRENKRQLVELIEEDIVVL